MKISIQKYFSELTRIQKYFPINKLRQIKEKQLKLKSNKVYDGMDFRNTNEITIKKKEAYYPIQHAKKLNNHDTNIITHKPPPMALTEYNRVPTVVSVFEEPEFDSPEDSKCLEIGILGPPNAGKSSLLNKLVGSNISAVSSKYGTTYKKIHGIYTDINNRIQLVFTDTPGAIKISPSIRSRRIMTEAWGIIPDSDKILFVVDAVKHLDITTREAIKRLLSHKYKPSVLKVFSKIKALKTENISIEEIIKIQKEVQESEIDKLDYEPRTLSSVLVMNKVDLVVNKRKLKSLQEEIEDIGAFDKVFHVSCETGYGLQNLLDYIKKEAQKRPWKHHPELKSLQSDQEKCEEIVKGIIFNRFYKEFPYGTIVNMVSWVPSNNGQLHIKFQIEVRYQVQVAMFVGEKGRIIKELIRELDKQLTKFYQMPVTSILTVVARRKGIPLEVLNQHTSLAL